MNILRANDLFDQGVLSELYKSGFLSEKVFIYREIYLWVDLQMKVRKLKKEQAVVAAEVQFNVSRRTVYNALDKFSAEGFK